MTRCSMNIFLHPNNMLDIPAPQFLLYRLRFYMWFKVKKNSAKTFRGRNPCLAFIIFRHNLLQIHAYCNTRFWYYFVHPNHEWLNRFRLIRNSKCMLIPPYCFWLRQSFQPSEKQILILNSLRKNQVRQTHPKSPETWMILFHRNDSFVPCHDSPVKVAGENVS